MLACCWSRCTNWLICVFETRAGVNNFLFLMWMPTIEFRNVCGDALFTCSIDNFGTGDEVIPAYPKNAALAGHAYRLCIDAWSGRRVDVKPAWKRQLGRLGTRGSASGARRWLTCGRRIWTAAAERMSIKSATTHSWSSGPESEWANGILVALWINVYMLSYVYFKFSGRQLG